MEFGRVLFRSGVLRIASERLCPLDDRPAEIRSAVTGPHQVDFLDRRLTDVADQQVPGHRIEAGAERIAQAQGPDLPSPTAAHERVVRWNTIVARGIAREGIAADVDAQDLAEQDIAVLSVILRIARAAAISRPDIQEAVRSEIYPAAIMVGEGLVEAQNQVRAQIGRAHV